MINVTTENQNDWLFTSYVLDYPKDNYHKIDGDNISELEESVRTIRRRYKNQIEYIQAKSLYVEYMEYLIEKYGGPEVFKLRFKAGDIKDYIPHRPRMRNTTLNKKLMKENIILSDTSKLKVDVEGMKQITEEYPEVDVHLIDGDDKVAIKMASKGFKQNTRDLLKGNNTIDYLERYFANKSNSSNKTYLNNNVKYNFTLTDYLNDDVIDVTDEGYQDPDDIVYYKGETMSRGNIQQLSVMEEFNKFGWNSLKMMKNIKGNKAVTKIMKQRKKKVKKISKKKIKEYDSFMVDIIGDNHMSYDDFEEDMLDFTAKNIFK